MAHSPYRTPFQPVNSGANSSSPTLTSTAGHSTSYALESTGVREWPYPTNRAVLVTSFGSDAYWINFGTSAVIASTGVGIPILGGSAQTFTMPMQLASSSPLWVGVASSTDVVAMFTLGHGF